MESILTLIAFQWDYLVTILKKSISWEWTIWKADKNWSILWKRANWLSLIKKKNDNFSRLWNNTTIKKAEGTVRSQSPLLFFCFHNLFLSLLILYQIYVIFCYPTTILHPILDKNIKSNIRWLNKLATVFLMEYRKRY